MEEKKEGGKIFIFITSLFLGIFPSFLIFSMFNQSNFSILKYWDFLMNINSSWISWISIFFVTLIIYRLLSKLSSKKKKFFVFFFVLFLLIAFVIAYLYANFLLGNDILVKLSADKENLFFNEIQNQMITFTISAHMNPFCLAQCTYSFLDISTGEIIETGSFDLNPILSTHKEYSFSSEGKVHGQELNRFEVSCKSQKTRLCYTKEEESKRAMLITLNYGISQEQEAKNEISKKEIISLEKKIYNSSERLSDILLGINELNSVIFTEGLLSSHINLLNSLLSLNLSFNELKKSWAFQDYYKFEKELPIILNRTNELVLKEDNLMKDINSNISLYNQLVKTLENSREKLEKISLENKSEDFCIDLNDTIVLFNREIKNLNQKSSLINKEKIIKSISLETDRLYELSEEENGSVCLFMESISQITPKKLIFVNRTYTIPELNIEDSPFICCLYGQCEKCCDETCSNKNYPILFLHGHSFNKDTSADYSLDAFRGIKEKLEEEGYIDAGAIVISQSSEQTGLWGKVNAPIEVTGSYFFDISKSETGQETIVPSKTDNIDTYSLRLNDLIDTVKVRTGKDKVIVVAHSMGGLVTRRYIQIFGEKDDIEKIIFITVPNHGIEGNIKNYCPLIGSQVECNDMNKDSLLMNKLNNAKNISMPIYNVIGIGCNMDGEQGDGVVKEYSQYLEYATNFYVEGSCNEMEFSFLHETILSSEIYPQVYEFISEKIKN
jgi:uncharacterized alpha/beta hydrolase family protein